MQFLAHLGWVVLGGGIGSGLRFGVGRVALVAFGAVSESSQSRRNALISVSEKPRSCSFWIQSMRLTALPG